MNVRQPRILSIDDNIRSVGGHFLEMALLLGNGASQLGYEFQLATHESFDPTTLQESVLSSVATFRTHRTVYWSLGVDGHSAVRRNHDGKLVEGSVPSRLWSWLREAVVRGERRPASMIRRWADDFTSLVELWKPRTGDFIVINTADDFLMLAVSRALRQIASDVPLDIHIVFHFAVFDRDRITRRAQMFGRQVNQALEWLPHRVSLYGTTRGLVTQLQEVGVSANAVPYPTRQRQPTLQQTERPEQLKLVLAGMPRREKGREKVSQMLSLMEPHLTPSGPFRVSMQMPATQWKRMIPRSLHSAVETFSGECAESTSALEVRTGYLSTAGYHEWLDTADVGIFLYDADRYRARCSGVLLEMQARGIPVIVPERCWLAEQVEAAGGDGSVGYIYQSVADFPAILSRMQQEYPVIRARAVEIAETVARRHSGAMSLRAMGIEPSGFTSATRHVA